jgi:hypothetical protein
MTGFSCCATAFAATYYVDCTAGKDQDSGAGPRAAWRTLTPVNRQTFQPGDRILLRAGCSWIGQLSPRGSGAAGNPIALDRYGAGVQPLIRGEGIEAAVLLDDQEYWEISNLAVTNDAAVEGLRRSVLVRGGKRGVTLHHIYLRGLSVEHVKGKLGSDMVSKNTGGSGFEIHGAASQARFDDIAVEHCSIASVDNIGIYVWSESMPHPRDPRWEQLRFTNVKVRDNRMRDIGKNAIVVRASIAPIIEGNVVERSSQRLHGNAIYVFGSKEAVIQFNEVFATRLDNIEGAAFDSDYNSEGTVIQYNYSHDNGGGLVDLCSNPEAAPPRGYNDGTIVRYNISQNDVYRVFGFDGPVTNAHIYNNTVYIGPGVSPRIIDFDIFGRAPGYASRTWFLNNIIYNLGGGTYVWGQSTDNVFESNCFFGKHAAGEPSDPERIMTDPLFVAPGTGGIGRDSVGGYKLRPASPCLESGIDVPGHGERDYWGNKLYSGAPDRGAFELPLRKNAKSEIELRPIKPGLKPLFIRSNR